LASELRAEDVAARLAALRARYEPESVAEAALRLADERPPVIEHFADGVQRRLGELRALCELARHVHGR
jgi:hypothetical protein